MLKEELKRKLKNGIPNCDICGCSINAKDQRDLNFEYSKTKRGEVWAHTTCWNKLYGRDLDGKEKNILQSRNG